MSHDTFTDAYIECALWSSTDENGNPLDDNYDTCDLAESTVAEMVADCADFQESYADLLELAGGDSQNGHDFWLTRNRHGAGFWDRGHPADVGKGLTDAAHAYGSRDLYVGDDGKVYQG